MEFQLKLENTGRTYSTNILTFEFKNEFDTSDEATEEYKIFANDGGWVISYISIEWKTRSDCYAISIDKKGHYYFFNALKQAFKECDIYNYPCLNSLFSKIWEKLYNNEITEKEVQLIFDKISKVIRTS